MVVAFEALNFAVLVLLMRRFLFRPVAKAVDARRQQIQAERTEMEVREAAAAAVQEEYAAKRGALEAEMDAKAETVIAEAERRAGEIIEEGRQRAKALVASTNEECDLARARALEELRLEVSALAVDAATRVIRNMGTPSVSSAYARRAGHTLQELLTEGRATLDRPIEVHVAQDAEPDAVLEELRAILGPRADFVTHTDPDLVGGVRLQIAGHEVEASASSSLRRWYEEAISKAV